MQKIATVVTNRNNLARLHPVISWHEFEVKDTVFCSVVTSCTRFLPSFLSEEDLLNLI